MKKSIFNRKTKDPKFKDVYDKVAVQLAVGEKIAELKYKAIWERERKVLGFSD